MPTKALTVQIPIIGFERIVDHIGYKLGKDRTTKQQLNFAGGPTAPDVVQQILALPKLL